MTEIIWNQEKFSVGVPLLDEQHKELINLINALYLITKNNKTSEQKDSSNEISTLFNQFKDYTNYHFKAEEKYFENLNYKDLTLHKLQHKHFIEYLNELSYKIKTDNTLSEELLFFLTDWLFNHIITEDKKFIQMQDKV